MKNIQSKIKPIKIGKQPGTPYCLGPEKTKMTNKIPREKSHCVVCRLMQIFEAKNK